jgi:serine/threonine protein kinase
LDSPSLPPGTRLGKYLLGRLIGSGGMGHVYEATHLELRKRVAVKTLLPLLAAHREARARFLREGEAASRIQHPNVVNVTDVGTEEQTPFLVMEFLEGENLAQRLAREGGLAVPAILDLLLPIMDALASGHDEGVVHRDLKPHNIFLARGRDGRVVPKLLDFGVSKLVGDDPAGALTGSMAVLGTAQYMAPEQIDGPRNVDARTDQYALGLVLYECVTGSPARQGTSMMGMLKAVASDPSPSLLRARPDTDPAFAAVLSRALSFEPAGRFPSLRELMVALLPFAGARARAQWSEVVTGRVDSGSDAAPVMARTVLLADSGSLKSPAASTTFRNANGALESPTYPSRRSGRAAVALAVLALAGVAGIVVRWGLPSWRGSATHGPAVRDEVSRPASQAVAPVQHAELPPPAAAKRRFQLRATPPQSTIELDGKNLGGSPLDTEVSPGGHELVVSAPGFQTVRLQLGAESSPPALIELVPEAAAPPRRRHRTAEGADRRSRRTVTPTAAPAEEPARKGVNDSLILQ